MGLAGTPARDQEGTHMKRALLPSLNPTGLGSAAAAVYAGIVMILNAAHHHAVIDPQVIVAALSAAGFLYTRLKVTPVADPRDGNGAPLRAPAAVITAGPGTSVAAAAPAPPPSQPEPPAAPAPPPAAG
jgi:hypothetical protein